MICPRSLQSTAPTILDCYPPKAICPVCGKQIALVTRRVRGLPMFITYCAERHEQEPSIDYGVTL